MSGRAALRAWVILTVALPCCAPPTLRMTGEKPARAPSPTGSVLEVMDWPPLVCALFKGRVECFSDSYFEVVLAPPARRRGRAHRIDFPSPVVALASGDGHTCGLTVEGNVYCFGSNRGGQLTTALTQEPTIEPVRIPLGRPAIAIASETERVCALHSQGTVSCWGNAQPWDDGAAGARRRQPQVMQTADGAVLTGVERLGGLIALRSDGAFSLQYDLGTSFGSPGIARPLRPPGPVRAAATAQIVRCMADAHGLVRCDAGLTVGQLTAPGFVPVELRCETTHCCARGERTGVTCWGLGILPEPVQVLNVWPRAFALGFLTTCFAVSMPESPCDSVACLRNPWTMLHYPEEPPTDEWGAEDPLLYGERPALIPLCVGR